DVEGLGVCPQYPAQLIDARNRTHKRPDKARLAAGAPPAVCGYRLGHRCVSRWENSRVVEEPIETVSHPLTPRVTGYRVIRIVHKRHRRRLGRLRQASADGMYRP